MKIKIKYHNNAKKLKKFDKGDWIDLYANEDVDLYTGDYGLINLGVSMKLPDGYEAHVVPRSSTFKTWGIVQSNSKGIIDNSYSGNDDVWMFPYYSTRTDKIEKGDKICQFRIIEKQPEIEFDEVEYLDGENRGGFGSSGKR